jgi:5'-3' exonuclease
MAGGMVPQRLMLLDSASLYFRAYHGVPDRRASAQDPPSNAVRGFLDMVATLVSSHRPTHLVACWDNNWRPAFRVEAMPSYKAHRLAEGSLTEEQVPADLAVQVPVIAEVLAAIGIARAGADGYEADDVIGTLTQRSGGAVPVDIVSGDRDLFQLVDERGPVHVLYTGRGGVREADRVDIRFLRQRYAVASGAAYADMAVLRGEPSDGLPGGAGIGEKTAARLIGQHGDLAGLRAAVRMGDATLTGRLRSRLEAAEAYLDAAPAVVRVARDAPVGPVDAALPATVVDPPLLARLTATQRLERPVGRVVAALGLG